MSFDFQRRKDIATTVNSRIEEAGKYRETELQSHLADYRIASAEAKRLYSMRTLSSPEFPESAENRKARLQADLLKHEIGELISPILKERAEQVEKLQSILSRVMNPETSSEDLDLIAKELG